MDFLTYILIGVFIIFIKFFTSGDPPKINSIYSQPGKWYWLKYGIFKFLLTLRKRQQNQEVTGENAGMGVKSRNTPEEMDRVQPLPDDEPLAVDAVYITGSNKDGQFLVTATARRQDNLIQTIVYLRLPETGFLELPSMPDTSLKGDKNNEYSAGGLHIQVKEPMKRWNMKFDGKLRQVSSGKLLSVKFDLNWDASTSFFDFDTDLHPNVLCDAVAREKWSREMFDRLKRTHQTHYEQFGQTTGVAHVEGYTPVEINIQGVRDHSYGNIRDWKQLHRYCIQYASFSDGTYVCVAAISMPITMSRLHCGYMFHPSGEMVPVSWSDLEFYNLGDDGNAVQNFTIRFKAGSDMYTLRAKVLDSRIFYIGHGRDAKIHERYCQYEMGDKVGYGLSEWEYMNTDGTEPQNNMGLNY